MKTQQTHKPVIETIINTAAIALSGFAVSFIINNGAGWEHIVKGLVLLSAGAGLEWFKYWGRQKDLW